MASDIGKGLCWQTVKYDANEFKFDKMFLKVALDVLDLDSESIDKFEQLHDVLPDSKLPDVYKACYDYMESDEFKETFHAYIKKHIKSLFPTEIYYQRKPGIRIHRPHTQTVQYHTDEWYGHGDGVVNFWMPLTHAHDTNSLYVASLEESLLVVDKLESDAASIEEINDGLREICKPIDVRVGDTFVFCSKVAHGTERNETTTSRVSLDFRVLVPGDDPGSKPLTEFYQYTGETLSISRNEEDHSEARDVACYIFPKHGFTRYISAHHQRLVCQDFAKKNNLHILAEETEIKTMRHHPALLGLAGGVGTHNVAGVILFSVLCLPEEEKDRVRIYESSISKGNILYFANENLKLFERKDIAIIEKKRKDLFE